jgi:hypothetical protein
MQGQNLTITQRRLDRRSSTTTALIQQCIELLIFPFDLFNYTCRNHLLASQRYT